MSFQSTNSFFIKFQPKTDSIQNTKKTLFSKSLELVLSNKIGHVTDSAFRSITLRKWNSKFKYLNKEDFKVALKSTKNISKHHPSNFQKKVILALNSKIEEVKTNFNIILSKENV